VIKEKTYCTADSSRASSLTATAARSDKVTIPRSLPFFAIGSRLIGFFRLQHHNRPAHVRRDLALSWIVLLPGAAEQVPIRDNPFDVTLYGYHEAADSSFTHTPRCFGNRLLR
jgi:hypothetical protein